MIDPKFLQGTTFNRDQCVPLLVVCRKDGISTRRNEVLSVS